MIINPVICGTGISELQSTVLASKKNTKCNTGDLNPLFYQSSTSDGITIDMDVSEYKAIVCAFFKSTTNRTVCVITDFSAGEKGTFTLATGRIISIQITAQNHLKLVFTSAPTGSTSYDSSLDIIGLK